MTDGSPGISKALVIFSGRFHWKQRCWRQPYCCFWVRFFYGLNWKYLTGMLLISKLSINFNTKGYVCRHVGDLGNIIAGEDKGVITYMTDSMVKLSGDNSVLGRAVVVSTCIIVIIITSTRHSCQYYVITIWLPRKITAFWRPFFFSAILGARIKGWFGPWWKRWQPVDWQCWCETGMLPHH